MYNENSIRSLSDLEHIVHRPSAYIPNLGFEGHSKINFEIIDNATDEVSLIRDGSGRLDVVMIIDDKKNTYSMVVRDNGRGIPVGKTLISSFSTARTSGKFDSNSGYTTSAGLFGWGSTVTLALSSWFRVISKNKSIIGDVTINRNNIPEEIDTVYNTDFKTGTIVMYTPDNSILLDFDEYIDRLGGFIDSLSKLSLFSKFAINFYLFKDRSIISKLKKGTTYDIIDLVNRLCSNPPTFTNIDFDRNMYIRNYFNISQEWKGIFDIRGSNADNSLTIDGNIYISITNNPSSNNKLTFVNTILFDDNNSLHISMFILAMKQHIVQFVPDNMKKFFIENYKLPIWLVLDVKYRNAQFSGFAKTSFKDDSFKHPYNTLLNKVLTKEMISNIYHLIENHIKNQYDKWSNVDFRPSTTMKGLLAKLNRPSKFFNCSTTNREEAELFLVEGDSAKIDQDRDSRFQASYTLGGKPFNGLTFPNRIEDSVQAIKSNHVFEDIVRILNITPGSNNLSNLNFAKTFITADADTHGYHISNIVIGNLYMLCPELINQGHVYVVIPPLYSLTIKGNKPIYIRNEDELNVTLAYHVYYRCLELELETPDIQVSNIVRKRSHILAREEFVIFCELVNKIGDELKRLSIEYTIPAILLEQLALMTNHLDLKNPNIYMIQQLLGCEVRYVQSSNIIIISIGSEDIVVPLNQITDLIYSRILPLYREFYYSKTRIYATTKNSIAMSRAPISIMQLYGIFEELRNLFVIERYKGLGSMESPDKIVNCTSPKTRRVFRITNIGDLNVVFDMLGNDPSERKKLLSGNLM